MSRHPRRRLLAVFSLAAVLHAAAVVAQTGPATPQRIATVALKAIPTTVTYRARPVRIRHPESPEVRALGGSGGPIIEIVITPPDGTAAFVFETQGIGLAVVDSATDWPGFEIWSSTGAGLYTRAIYTWRAAARQYCADQVEEFEGAGTEAAADTVTVAGWPDRARFVRARSFGCQP
jgi:hypothetical protein